MGSSKKTKADVLASHGVDQVVVELYSTDSGDWDDPAGGYVTDDQVRQNQVLLDHAADRGLAIVTERKGRSTGRVKTLTRLAGVAASPKQVMGRDGRPRSINEYEFSFGQSVDLSALDLTRRDLDAYVLTGAPIDAIRTFHPRILDELLGSPVEPPVAHGGLDGGAVPAVTMARRNQAVLRRLVAERQGAICAVTGTEVLEALEVAHLVRWHETEAQDPSECLLLRADIHALEERGLVRFDASSDWPTVALHPSLRHDATYGPFHNRPVAIPPAQLADRQALDRHWGEQGSRSSWS